MSIARNQTQYQVRFDWGVDGAAAIAPGAHIVIWADALATAQAPDPAALAATLPEGCAVVVGTVGNRLAVAQWVLACQSTLGDRAVIAVVAAGTDDGRFAVEDLLAAGAVIDAIADIGIDYTSPEAAAAVGAYAGLRNATSHVLTACVTGRELADSGHQSVIDLARSANSVSAVHVVREFSIQT
ncbi:MAG: 2-phosphosulfolactate phosphatase [Microbacteriaceae bacterium]